MLSTITNQSHRLNWSGYFEWWYFHFVATQPVKINMVLHETDIFGFERVPYISASLLLTNGQPTTCYFRRNLTLYETIIQDGGRYLRVTGDLFNEDEKGLAFHVQMDRLQFVGYIEKLLPPVVIQGGILFEDMNTQAKKWWVAQIPLGKFKARLVLEDNDYHLDGFAYLDHNWGTAPIQDHVRDWIWGYFAGSGQAIIFYRIQMLDKVVIDRGILTSKMRALTTTRLITSSLDKLSMLTNPEKVDSFFGVNFPEHDCKLQFHLSERNLMRRRLSESYLDFIATYCRWTSSSEKYKPAYRKEMLAGVVEYLRIRRSSAG